MGRSRFQQCPRQPLAKSQKYWNHCAGSERRECNKITQTESELLQKPASICLACAFTQPNTPHWHTHTQIGAPRTKTITVVDAPRFGYCQSCQCCSSPASVGSAGETGCSRSSSNSRQRAQAFTRAQTLICQAECVCPPLTNTPANERVRRAWERESCSVADSRATQPYDIHHSIHGDAGRMQAPQQQQTHHKTDELFRACVRAFRSRFVSSILVVGMEWWMSDGPGRSAVKQ